MYETSDGKHMAVGAIEPQFYAEFLASGLSQDPRFMAHMDSKRWPELKQVLTRALQDQDARRVDRTLRRQRRLREPRAVGARGGRPSAQRGARHLRDSTEALQAAPAPRFSRTPGAIQRPPAVPGAHTDEALLDWGFEASRAFGLRAKQAIA